jgi:hypothetical protein
MNLTDLKKEHSSAHDSLIDMWAELSRISIASAKRDIKEDLGIRYVIEKKGTSLVFKDGHAGDIFVYDATQDIWNLL